MFVVIVRTAILYSLVVIVMRLMGKRQLGELQPYELVITIMISDLASLPMQDTRLPLLLGIIPIITMLIIQIFVSEIQLRSEKIRSIIDGKPSILLRNGKIDTKALREQRINIDDLMEELRVNGYFNIDDIAYVILENNGQISVIPKANLSPVTRNDLNISVPQDILPTVLIVDGKINKENLKSINKDINWLIKNINKFNIQNTEDVFIALMDSHNKFFCQQKDTIRRKE
ncbi:Uncharacterized membrane protein YcaP, DUF421 family [Clostridium amylolyticum]|uniref:Uncharacterized membrane protein YcaP, DUF421 family n=1 Tax=Clostridium amylolyticum TaxID=1121298 RepID=A0A1M6JFG8_9CLOT|nr:DUF421 domain-containing protein [Clostridium amylolyticum]SHJ45458.1 Uncharacterized membrane protein YcaP, DUF421 family [Clostridium amylolyticum]